MVMLAGKVKIGGSVSDTNNRCVALAVTPQPSVTIHSRSMVKLPGHEPLMRVSVNDVVGQQRCPYRPVMCSQHSSS
jgi:hypothetical protein